MRSEGGLFAKLRSVDAFHRLAILVVASNLTYLVWLTFRIYSPIGVIFYILELLVFAEPLLFIVNHWTRRTQLMGGSYSLRTPVDVFIPIVNEPLGLVRKVVAAAAAIDHPGATVYVLDDGGRKAIQSLAAAYGCQYLSRPDRKTNRYKAANLNYGLAHSYGTYVLVIDADNIVRPTILDDLLGHFSEDKVALVASRQAFTIAEGDFNHDYLFYNHMQNGKNSDHAAISCGSGVVYSRACLEKIGRFSEWNIVEDLHTTYKFNSIGMRSVYVAQAYTLGTAPSDLSQVYKQRGTWALDTLRIFFWQQPLFNFKLPWRQRLHYFEIGYCYVVSALFLPGIFLINFYSLLGNDQIIHGGWWYVVMRLPALIFTLTLFGQLSQGQLTSRVWAGLFPVYQVAVVKALWYRTSRPLYKVTSKVSHGRREIRLVWPQLAMILLATGSLVVHLLWYGFSFMFTLNFFWISVMIYWLWPVIHMGFSSRAVPKKVQQAQLQRQLSNS